MKNIKDDKKIVVLIDADNAQITKIERILTELSYYGDIIIKRAYADWSRESLKTWKLVLHKLAIDPIQQFAYTTGKNATDILMIIDAMDLLYENRFDAFAIVSSDCDFTRLASRLKQSEIFVFGVGEQKTPIAFRNACDTFILTENLQLQLNMNEDEKIEKVKKILLDNNSNITKNEAQTQNEETLKPIDNKKRQEIINLTISTLHKHGDDDGWLSLNEAGKIIRRLKPDFDPRTYGVTNLTELISEYLNKYFKIRKRKIKEGNMIIEYSRKK